MTPDEIKAYKAKNAFFAGVLDAWAITLEMCPEITDKVIRDMKEMAISLKKSSGVLLLHEKDYQSITHPGGFL